MPRDTATGRSTSTTSAPASSLTQRLTRSGFLVRQTLDLVHVGALDADEARGTLAPGRVEIALVVHVSHARLQAVAPDVAHLARPGLARRLDQGPVVHQRLTARLAIDRPGRPVIVRVALPRASVNVGQDAEAELRVLVEDLALRHVVTQVRGDERVVLQHVLHEGAHLLAARGTGIRGQDVVGGGGERLERVSHGRLLRRWSAGGRAAARSCSRNRGSPATTPGAPSPSPPRRRAAGSRPATPGSPRGSPDRPRSAP